MNEQDNCEDRLQGLQIPEHIGIVMDGNGRWAQQRGLPRIQGHFEGAKATKRAVIAAGEIGVGALSVYAFSAENWKRPNNEVDVILSLIEDTLRTEMQELHERECKLSASGRLHELPESLAQTFEDAVQLTRDNTGLKLNVLVNYGGRAEIVDAARSLCEKTAAGELDIDHIDEELFSQHMYAPQLPDPELILRPGGEFRLSNFLLWECAYSEVIVLPVLWPDFQREHLVEGIVQYNQRERRLGGLPENEGDTAV